MSRRVLWLVALIALICAGALVWSMAPALSWAGSDAGFLRGSAKIALIGVGGVVIGFAIGQALRLVAKQHSR